MELVEVINTPSMYEGIVFFFFNETEFLLMKERG